MGTLGYFIVFMLIFFIGKFIYDSYLTNNTNKRWQEHKSVHTVNEIKGVAKAVKDIDAKELHSSMMNLAEEFNCALDDVEAIILENFDNEMTTEQQALDTIELCKEKAIIEAESVKIDLNNTCSSIIARIAQKYIETIKKETEIDYEYNKNGEPVIKASLYNYYYSKRYLSQKFGCQSSELIKFLKNDVAQYGIHELLLMVKKHTIHAMEESSVSETIHFMDTPSFIIRNVVFGEWLKRIEAIEDYGGKVNDELSEGTTLILESHKKNVLNNTKIIAQMLKEYGHFPFIANRLKRVKEVYESIELYFSEKDTGF